MDLAKPLPTQAGEPSRAASLPGPPLGRGPFPTRIRHPSLARRSDESPTRDAGAVAANRGRGRGRWRGVAGGRAAACKEGAAVSCGAGRGSRRHLAAAPGGAWQRVSAPPPPLLPPLLLPTQAPVPRPQKQRKVEASRSDGAADSAVVLVLPTTRSRRPPAHAHAPTTRSHHGADLPAHARGRDQAARAGSARRRQSGTRVCLLFPIAPQGWPRRCLASWLIGNGRRLPVLL